MILVIYTSHTNSRPFLVTAAFCVRPVDTWVTWVSLLGRGSFTGEDTPIPQKKTELRAGGLADSASKTGKNKLMMNETKGSMLGRCVQLSGMYKHSGI